jgi:hypothetical protein
MSQPAQPFAFNVSYYIFMSDYVFQLRTVKITSGFFIYKVIVMSSAISPSHAVQYVISCVRFYKRPDEGNTVAAETCGRE